MRGSWWHGNRYQWNRDHRDKGWDKGNRDKQMSVGDVMEIGQTWEQKRYSRGRRSRMDLSEIHRWSISNTWPPSEIPTLCYHSPEPQLTPKNSNTISSPFKNPEQPLRTSITFLSSLFYFSPLTLCFHFHDPISVSIFPFPIYCSISILLLSHSSLHSTIIH